MRLGRPVQWIEDRREHLMATNHSRQQYHDIEIGFDADGTDRGPRRPVHGRPGRVHPHARRRRPRADGGAPARAVPHPELQSEARCVLTNKTPTGTYRGPGRFECTFVRERLIDIARRPSSGVDPARAAAPQLHRARRDAVRGRRRLARPAHGLRLRRLPLRARPGAGRGRLRRRCAREQAAARRAGALPRDRRRLRAGEGRARPVGVRAGGGRRHRPRRRLLRRRGGRAGDRDDAGPGRAPTS